MSIGGLSGWVSTLGDKIDTVSGTYITAVVGTLSTELAPLILVALTIYWLLLGLAVMRGEVQAPLWTTLWRAVKVGLIVSLALDAAMYNQEIVGMADGLRDGMATVFAGSAVTPGVTPTTMWGAIDKMSDDNYTLLNEAAKTTSWYDLPSALSLLLMDVGFLILSLACVYIGILSKLFSTFFLGVGPLFIACLLFKPTQRFFDGWLGMVLNTIVLSWIGLFVVAFSMNVSSQFIAAMTPGWASLNPVTTGLQYCGICLVLAMMIYQAPGWAAALTGGSSMQMGAAMARDAAMTYRGFVGNKSPTTPTTTNNIQQQSRLARLSNAMGRGAGRAVNAGGQAMAGAGQVAGQAIRAARYRIAALRGRS